MLAMFIEASPVLERKPVPSIPWCSFSQSMVLRNQSSFTSELRFVFSLEMLLSCVGVHAGSQTGQLEVSECTLFAPSIGDVTEDGVTASCQPPLPWKETHKRLFERRN